MDLDLNRLNGISSCRDGQNLQQVHFAVGANSFFPILIFNNMLRAIEPGSMALIPRMTRPLPAPLGASLNQLVVEKLPSGQGSDLAVRDSNTGFTFFNVQGRSTEYDTNAQSLAITMADWSFQKSLPTRSAVHRTLAQPLEQSPSAR